MTRGKAKGIKLFPFHRFDIPARFVPRQCLIDISQVAREDNELGIIRLKDSLLINYLDRWRQRFDE